MNKHLLLIPFMALLATSCSGGHITTTPIAKNAPSAPLSAPTKKNLPIPTGYADDFSFAIQIQQPSDGAHLYKLIDGQETTNPSIDPALLVQVSGSSDGQYYLYWRGKQLPMSDYCYNLHTINCDYLPSASSGYGSIRHLGTDPWPISVMGRFRFQPYEKGYTTGYDNGYTSGYSQGYEEGEQDGYYSESNKLIPNGMYTGLTIFPRRHYLENYAVKVMSGQVNPANGQFYLNDTNANYTIEMKWTYKDSEKITAFYSYGDLLIGELDWHDVAEGYWNSTWFGKYDAELHHFIDTKNYATNGPIETSFYPEIYLGSTFTGGDPNLYFAGGGNAYQMGFADGQSYTIHASETYQNVFTIFTPAFRAVADFFNLNIGPFKVWYFFAIPLIVTLLILVLRLVKH